MKRFIAKLIKEIDVVRLQLLCVVVWSLLLGSIFLLLYIILYYLGFLSTHFDSDHSFLGHDIRLIINL